MSNQNDVPASGATAGAREGHKDRPLSERRRPRLDASFPFRRAVLDRLRRIEQGRITIVDRQGELVLGEAGNANMTATIHVHHDRFYRAVCLGGGMGGAEAYIRGDWDSPDLAAVMRVLAQNAKVLAGLDHGAARLLRSLRILSHWMRRNTRTGSKRNISAHYDLSNDFFELMLDSTMTYSSGIFPSATASLAAASIEKYDRICRKLQLRPDDHLLEIGTGWGGFAEHVVRNYGCRVTTTTISDSQHAYAERRFRDSTVAKRVTLLKEDYRDLAGTYDKLVSIEMIEAVGEKFLPLFFAKCSDLLKPQGLMCLQAITIPEDRYDAYRRSVDFIQAYIFPGGFLPSIEAIRGCVDTQTDMRMVHREDFGRHYARTLAGWRTNFWREIEAVRQLGFDETFIRIWHYYLCYCEAGFHENQIGVSQLLLSKCRDSGKTAPP